MRRPGAHSLGSSNCCGIGLGRYERLDGCSLMGPHSEYFVIDTAQQVRVMGVHFGPGGAFPFLPLPADDRTYGRLKVRFLQYAASPHGGR